MGRDLGLGGRGHSRGFGSRTKATEPTEAAAEATKAAETVASGMAIASSREPKNI
jgi:hypothetical protein